jgi:hypothetical protein
MHNVYRTLSSFLIGLWQKTGHAYVHIRCFWRTVDETEKAAEDSLADLKPRWVFN